jgi:hypothetical protein
VTVDQELTLLEDNIRKLKVEYEAYFSGGSKKPPDDLEWRVRNGINKLSDGRGLNFQQQFRYNTLANKYAVFGDLWRRKLKIKEEGYRRPQDALLAIHGLRQGAQAGADACGAEGSALPQSKSQPFEFADPGSEADKAHVLYQSLVEARRSSGAPPGAGFDSFREFLAKKTNQIRSQYGCGSVEFSIELENGHVRLKARGKT